MKISKILLRALAVVAGLLIWLESPIVVKADTVHAINGTIFTASEVKDWFNYSSNQKYYVFNEKAGPMTLILDEDLALGKLEIKEDIGAFGAPYESLTIKNDGKRPHKLIISSTDDNCLKVKDLTVEGVDIYVTTTYNSSAIYARRDITIHGGNIVARSYGNAIHAIEGKFSIDAGTVNAISTAPSSERNNGIHARNDIDISGESTVVKASAERYGCAVYSEVGTITIYEPLKVVRPDGGGISAAGDFISTTPGGDVAAANVLIKNKNDKDPASAKTHDHIPTCDDNSGHEDNTPAAATNPLSLVLVRTTGLPYGTIAARAEQGTAAKAVFAASTPEGWKEGLSFNLVTNGRNEITLKNGTFTLLIPNDLRKDGRTFAILALDRSGKVILLPDTDTDPSTITVAVDIEGYAFDLIYNDLL